MIKCFNCFNELASIEDYMILHDRENVYKFEKVKKLVCRKCDLKLMDNPIELTDEEEQQLIKKIRECH